MKKTICAALLFRVLKKRKPSFYLKLFLKLGLLPEFKDLCNTPQHEKRHPEGNVWEHTLLTVDKMSEFSNSVTLRLAALCHDIGKIDTTEIHDGGNITSYGHNKSGVVLIEPFLDRLKINGIMRNKILKLIDLHMLPVEFYKHRNEITKKAFRKLSRKLYPVTIEELLLLSEADKRGRGKDFEYQPIREWFTAQVDLYF